MTACDNKIIKTIQIVKSINYVSIRLTYINFQIKKALNNLSNATSILVTGAMREIDESKVGALLSWLPVTWSRFLLFIYENVCAFAPRNEMPFNCKELSLQYGLQCRIRNLQHIFQS